MRFEFQCEYIPASTKRSIISVTRLISGTHETLSLLGLSYKIHRLLTCTLRVQSSHLQIYQWRNLIQQEHRI